MHILVVDLKGNRIIVDVSGPDETVVNLKQKIYEMELVPPEKQHLVFKRQILEDGNTLKDYLILSDETIDLTSIFKKGNFAPPQKVSTPRGDIPLSARAYAASPRKDQSKFPHNPQSGSPHKDQSEPTSTLIQTEKVEEVS
ncbi:MAG: hypothetical protein EZS28_011983 [Streblomastix strix]|uniref:Ubiquitin-like domain-containing protein n=1 Tax=Streblomastix strix TaxID=222440 RepID=A0A5J4WCD7_9EUKA|nr:MAG: hypothetical protein EZS28_011983 [Streblomastix strix]